MSCVSSKDVILCDPGFSYHPSERNIQPFSTLLAEKAGEVWYVLTVDSQHGGHPSSHPSIVLYHSRHKSQHSRRRKPNPVKEHNQIKGEGQSSEPRVLSANHTFELSLSSIYSSMTVELQEIIINSSGEKTGASTTSPTLRKPAANPQQGMADLAAPSVGATCATTACTSPLTITSLEAAAANAVTNDGVPQVVSQVVPVVHPEPVVAVPSVEAMLAPMANLGLNTFPHPPPLDEERNMRMMRTPPTEHDNRKLFVGGLPTDGKFCYVDS